MSSVDFHRSSSYSSASSVSEKEEPIEAEQVEEMREQAKKVTEYGSKGICGASALGGILAGSALGKPKIGAGIAAAAPVAEKVAVSCTHKIIDDGYSDKNLIRSQNFKDKHCVIL